MLVLLFASSSRATIHYEVSLAHPEQHLFHVIMQIPDVTGEVTVQMPAWYALYQIRDFGSHVQQVEAFAGSEQALIEKLDKQTWRVTGKGTITIHYSTYWDGAGPFATQLNSEHAFINPAMILLYIPERRAEEIFLELSDVPNGWSAESPARITLPPPGMVRVFKINAPSYDALADSPVEVGQFEEFSLDGVSPTIRVVVYGDNWKKRRVEDALRRICAYELKLMDGAPFETYTFIFHIGRGAAGAGGGMEHANATAIAVPSDEYLPNVAAHEFFHLWNVKRIRPASLEPVDYSKEQYTRALWFAEGVTSTYGAYTLVRSGLWSRQQFYDDLGEQISELESRPANRWQSAEQSSLDAWLEKYPLYNRPENSVSYYTKGQVLGVLLDILIRSRTDNQKSLDEVLRALNTDFARQGRFYRDTLDIRLTAEKVAGGSLEEFFGKYVSGAEPLPYQQILNLAGLDLRTVEHTRATLGFAAERDANGTLVVQAPDEASPAAKAGLRAGDVILTWNGGDAPRRLDRWLYGQKPDDVLRLRVRREEKEIALEFPLGQVAETRYQVKEDSHSGEKAKEIREGVLRGVTGTTVR